MLEPVPAVDQVSPRRLCLCSSNCLAQLTLKRLSAEEEFPDLSEHNNHMAKVLSLDMYRELRERATPNGFTIDGVIQTGVDNPGTVTRSRPGTRWHSAH